MTKRVGGVDDRDDLLASQSTDGAAFSAIPDPGGSIFAARQFNLTGNDSLATAEYRDALLLGTSFWEDDAAKAGKNHRPQASNDTNGKDIVIEQGTSDPGDALAKGNVLANDRDPDKGDHLSVFQAKAVRGEFGTLHLTSNGAWTYTLNNKDPDTQALGDGEKGIEHFKYVAVDTHGAKDSAVLKITVLGRDDVATPPTVSEDFNGDLHSDVLFHKASGSVAMWQMDGSTIKANVTVSTTLSSAWHILATEDFGGDHLADVLLQNDNGSVALWKMNGSTVASNTTVGSIGSSWHFLGADDFNGDGLADVLWRNDSGNVAMWRMDGDKIIANQTVSTIGASWHFAGADDFNGDQMSDVLWFNDSGNVALWQMNGEKVAANTTVGKMDSGSTVVAVDDFSGDGKADILLRSSSGAISMWRMDGDKIVANETVGSINSTWSLADTGDYNGDGHADILWRNTNGNVAMWEMNGAHVDANVTVGSAASEWTIV